MAARNISNAEWFARHMVELHRELEMLKKKKKLDRREHRLRWRREYYKRKREEGVE